MARDAFPLLPGFGTRPAGVRLGGSIYMAFGGFRSEAGASESSACSIVTLMLRYGPLAHQRVAAMGLVASLDGVTETLQLFGEEGPSSHLVRILQNHGVIIVNLVLVLPEVSLSTHADPDEAVAALSSMDGIHVGLVVAVAEEPEEWKRLANVQGFITAKGSGLARTSQRAFLTVAALMAPVAPCEVDSEDLQTFLGPASAPAYFVGGQWERGGAEFIVPTDDQVALGRPAAVLLTTTCRKIDVREAQRVVSTFAELVGNACPVSLSMTTGFFSPTFEDDGPASVLALCRPALSACSAA